MGAIFLLVLVFMFGALVFAAATQGMLLIALELVARGVSILGSSGL